MSKDIHPSLQRLLDATQLSPSDLALALNTSPQAVTNWKTRGVPSAAAKRAEEVFGINRDYITHGTTRESNVGEIGSFELWSSHSSLSEEDYAFLPFFKDIEFQGGVGRAEMEDYNGFRLPFSKATLHRYNIPANQAFCVTLTGNSMEPVIPKGATIGINKADTKIKDGDIYAIRQEDLFRVKRLYRETGGKIRINSYNEAEYQDEIAEASEVEIIGRVFTWSVML